MARNPSQRNTRPRLAEVRRRSFFHGHSRLALKTPCQSLELSTRRVDDSNILAALLEQLQNQSLDLPDFILRTVEFQSVGQNLVLPSPAASILPVHLVLAAFPYFQVVLTRREGLSLSSLAAGFQLKKSKELVTYTLYTCYKLPLEQQSLLLSETWMQDGTRTSSECFSSRVSGRWYFSWLWYNSTQHPAAAGAF
jgi:hypothetical protein